MTGQINRGSFLGDYIYNLINDKNIINIVDIGTWNGMGTTKCIYDSIVDFYKIEYNVFSLEADPDFYNLALSNLPKLKNFNILLGRIIEKEDLLNLDELDNSFFISASIEVQKNWLSSDLKNYSKIPNVLNLIPDKIDLLILDGGEYSSYAEFLKLKDRINYLILDDTNVVKNFKVSEIIRNDTSYEVLIDSKERNGFMIAKKIII